MDVDDRQIVLWETGICSKGLTFTYSVFLIMQKESTQQGTYEVI